MNITYSALQGCPSCGHEFRARWATAQQEEPQQCPSCQHEFTAAWPGFEFTPEVVIAQE